MVESVRLHRERSGWFGPGVSNTFQPNGLCQMQQALWLEPPSHIFMHPVQSSSGMDVRPRLARWHHAAWKGRLGLGATSSTTPIGSSTASSSGLGVWAGRTDAGAPSPPVPNIVHQAPMHFGGGTPRTSSSRYGSVGSPASIGINPNTASPPAASWPRRELQ